MSHKPTLWLLTLILLSFKGQLFAQKINLTGTWVLNVAKSKLESPPDGLTSSLFIIHQQGDEFRLTRYHIFGEKKNKISFKMLADGHTRRIKLLFKGKLEPTENGFKATLWRKNFSNVVDYRFGSSQDEFIANEVMTSQPHSHHNIWVFDRKK